MKKFTITVEVMMNDYHSVREVSETVGALLQGRLTDNIMKITVVTDPLYRNENYR